MKNLFSSFVAILLCASLLLSFVGCNNTMEPSNNLGGSENPDSFGTGGGDAPAVSGISGIDAAKLLLAEERLNEKLLKNEGDIFEKGAQVMEDLAAKAIDNLGVRVLRKTQGPSPLSNFTRSYRNNSRASSFELSTVEGKNGTLVASGKSAFSIVPPLGPLGEEKNDIGNMEVVGDTVVWTDFDEVSNSYEYFLNLTANIVSEAERCADLINFVKKNIRIVDKWVEIGNERYFLSVGENEELLCNESGSGENRFLIICRRYRNEEGKDVYEMYRSYGTQYECRMTYIPGERYELSEGRQQHFIATNTKGYWENYVLGDIGDSYYNVSYLILKDDICYTFGMLDGDMVSLQILSADRETDLFHYSSSEHSTTLLLKLNGFSNIEKITAAKSKVEFGPENEYANLQWGSDAKIHIAGGTVIGENQSFFDGKLFIDGILVSAFGYGYGAEMSVNIQGTPDEAMALFKQFLKETGLGCKRDIDTVIEGTKKSITDSRAIFNYYQWNGYTVNTKEGIRQATLVEKAKYEAILALYEGLMDAEVFKFEGKRPEEIELQMSFAPITESVALGAKMVDDKLTLDSLRLSVNDVMLFVKDEPYRVVIALEDSTGAIVHLEQAVFGEVKYAEEKMFSVSASNMEIVLPQLTPGSYRVVAYIATSDGIRSSGFTAVAFEEANAEDVNLGFLDLSGSLDTDGVLTLTYTERIDVNVKMEFDTALSYDAFKQAICEQAFFYGIPDETSIEMEKDESYVALTGTESEIAEGVYRIKYTAENGSYSRKGYVYVALSQSVKQGEAQDSALKAE